MGWDAMGGAQWEERNGKSAMGRAQWEERNAKSAMGRYAVFRRFQDLIVPGIPNCRSLHSAPPDFLFRVVSPVKCVCLSLPRVANVAAVECS